MRNSIPGYPAKTRIIGMPYRYAWKNHKGQIKTRVNWRAHRKIFAIVGNQIAADGKVEFIHRRLDPPIPRAWSSEAICETIDLILTH